MNPKPAKLVEALFSTQGGFDDFYELDGAAAEEEYLRRWIEEINATDITPLHSFARMLEAHWDEVIRCHHTNISNGLLEGLNPSSRPPSAAPADTARAATSRR
jgi:hypothetical protein